MLNFVYKKNQNKYEYNVLLGRSSVMKNYFYVKHSDKQKTARLVGFFRFAAFSSRCGLIMPLKKF